MNHPLHQYLTGIQPENSVKENSEKSRMGKHKQVACQICFNFMRSDHVKGHMKVHQKYSPTNDTPQSAEDISPGTQGQLSKILAFPHMFGYSHL